jgi:hypothetical protein
MLKGLASPTTPVSKIMTPQESLAVLTPQHSVLEAMDLMVKYNVRHVPVVRTWKTIVASSSGCCWQRTPRVGGAVAPIVAGGFDVH